ncbi:MAG: hypothetical protein AW09_001096 [Candidatus Accumulibacter phosphatis]|uniref:Uncharacterized protein n=1 Tax=Candidatus Accumulibacter phosphatis TaxID=327160 RepID=A0A080LXN7_9PROT|nr:MAG: hypothetical protein AW09_001096 [Candidatus Accumulibacter phosphatis]MBL8406843.1 hypothetical protein [Accumulibacter sp.]HRF10991.1 hypothetical protein [Candidatus Accumulibacter phosphatis]
MQNKPPLPSRKQDTVSAEQVQALMDDIDNSIASIDEKLSICRSAPSRPVGQANSTIGLVYQHTFADAKGASSKTQTGEAPSPNRSGQGLLAELAHAAERLSQQKIEEDRSQQQIEQRFDRALRLIFDYLNQFTQHLNVIKPALSLVGYTLDFRHRFGTGRCAEGFVNYRTRSNSEMALIETVTLRLRYATEALDVIRPAEKAQELRDELDLLNLRITGERNVDLARNGSSVRFTLAGSIPVQVNFRCDLSNGRLIVRGRNFGALGLSAYLIDLERLSHASLEAIGLILLGRAVRLPNEFVPVAFHTRFPDEKTLRF